MRKRSVGRPAGAFPRRAMLALLLLTLLRPAPAPAQMKTGAEMKNFDVVLGVKSGERSYPFTVRYTKSTIPGNVLFPGEQGTLSFVLQNDQDRPIRLRGAVDVIPYGTRGIPGDIWLPEVVRLGKTIVVPLAVDIPAKAATSVTITPPIPEAKGAYALVVDLGPHGRQFVTSLVRTFRPSPTRLQYPKFSLDHLPDPVLRRLGVQSVREGVEWWLPGDPEAQRRWNDLDRQMRQLQKSNITVMLMVGASPVPAPLGRPRPHLTEDGTMTSSKSDMAWLPEFDPQFSVWVRQVCEKYGWPKGPLTAFNLWNEPWEGLSISGWGADMPRYREIYKAMADGVLAARKTGVEVLLAGADSSSNTWDKFFPDGTDTFLPILDAMTIHYQGMASPAVYKKFRERTSPLGRVLIWDTESWVANTDDRVAAVVATNRAAGYDRSMGIYGGNIASGEGEAVTAWPVAASVGAMQHFLGERPFRRLLYPNGLPWVFVFDGLPAHPAAHPAPSGRPSLKGGESRNPFPSGRGWRGAPGVGDDGTVVIVGDIGEEFGHNNVLFRTVRTLGNRDVSGVRQGTLTIPASPAYALYDFYGNPVAARNNRIVVPLDHRGFFLRPSGAKGSSARLLAALEKAQIRGFEPVEMIPRDFTKPVSETPTLRVTLTNVLNRPIVGTLTATIPGLSLTAPARVTLKPHTTQTVLLKVAAGSARADNAYPLTLRFDAGKDGVATHEETLHANVIARKTITVDGRLDDWQGAIPQTVSAPRASQRSLTEQAWLPMVQFDKNVGAGLATGFVAYDDTHFYFAAKIADSTPHAGTVRMATRDDDAYFYPEVSYETDPDTTLQWQLAKGEAPDDKTAPQAPSGDGRVRDYWEDTDTSLSYAFDLSLPKDRKTQVALYFGPWENHEDDGFGVRAYVTDKTTGKLLDERHVGRLWKGAYIVWNLSGDVRIRVRPVGDWYTAKVAGVFFDPAKTDNTFVTTDLDTSGDWKGVYGASGYAFAGQEPKLPTGATLTLPTETIRKEHRWPAGVRRFSYARWPELPAGHFIPAYDNVQIAFNVLRESEKTTIARLPGVPRHFTQYHDTDYEYALNKVAEKYGGGTEIWRLQYPGMPRKHFYPRQPRSPVDGPARGGALVVTHENGTRVVECAIPWDEMPAVRAAMQADKPIKFSFLVNDAGGAGMMELGRERSVAKLNASFHVDWAEHWANELEFGWER